MEIDDQSIDFDLELPKEKPTLKPCMTCLKEFKSHHKFHRICTKCKNRKYYIQESILPEHSINDGK